MNKNQFLVGLFATYLSTIPITTKADVSVRLSGAPDSALITVDVAGSGVWSGNRNSDYMMWASTSNFIPNSLSIAGSTTNVDQYLALMPIGAGIVLDNAGTSINIDRIYFDHDAGSNGDDFGFATSDGKFRTSANSPYQILGSAIVDLSVLSSSFVLADFESAVFSEPASSGHLIGALSGSITQTTTISAVPLPASAALFLPSLLGFSIVRKKTGAKK